MSKKWAALSLVAAFTLCVLGYLLLQRRLAGWIIKREKLLPLVTASETAFTLALAVVTGVFDLWKPVTWANPQADLRLPMALSGLAAGLIFVCKALGNESKNLAAAEAKTLRQQRDSLVYTAALLRSVVENRFNRLTDALSKRPFGVSEFLEALAPETQVTALAKAAHGFFQRDLKPGDKLRVGIYLKDRSASRLFCVYSWNGEQTNCVSQRWDDLMRLDNPGAVNDQGARPALVRCYQGAEALVLYPSCPEAASRGEFRYFADDQKNYLRSMVIYKLMTQRQRETDALLLTLDCSREGFFASGRRGEIEDFLVELSRRLDYELVVQDALVEARKTSGSFHDGTANKRSARRSRS